MKLLLVRTPRWYPEERLIHLEVRDLSALSRSTQLAGLQSLPVTSRLSCATFESEALSGASVVCAWASLSA
jgi:hypothetical protein